MRACDSCRRRKVKCDFETPECSSCRISKLACGYVVPAKKRGPRGRRGISNSQSPAVSSPTDPRSIASPSTVGSSVLLDNHVALESVNERSSRQGLGLPSPDLRLSSRTTAVHQQPGYPSADCDDSRQLRGNVQPDTPERESIRFALLVIYDELNSSIDRLGLAQSIEVLALECLNLYIQYLFPIMPIVHECSLRASLSLLTSQSEIRHAVDTNITSADGPSSLLASDLDLCRRFALLTALCAETSFVCPSRFFPQGRLVGNYFLKASRRTLSLIQDQDIEDPNSSSIIIRYFHANSIHTACQSRLAWHLLGEVIRLVQSMSLHLEASLEGLDIVEAQLRRNVFWQIYTGDKSSALLNDHATNLHEFSLKGQMTLQDASSSGYSLLVHACLQTPAIYEIRIMKCFHLCQKLWAVATRIIQDVQRLEQLHRESQGTTILSQRLTDMYVDFISFRDELPPWLRYLTQPSPSDDEVTSFQYAGFWIQRINLHVTFHFLNLVILQRFADLNLLELIGFSSEPTMIALKKTEIARDMLSTIQEAPFEYLQVNGESCVEKIRQVGANLLQIANTVGSERVTKRAQAELPELLEILARLDSRASDSIVNSGSKERFLERRQSNYAISTALSNP